MKSSWASRWCRNKRLAAGQAKLQLLLEAELLRRSRRQIAEIVQASLADSHDVGLRMQSAQGFVGLAGVIARMVRMDASRGIQILRPALGQRVRVDAALFTGAGDDDLRHSDCARVVEHVGQVVGE